MSINNKLYGYKLNFSNFVFHISMQTNYKKGGKRLFFCFSFFWQKGTYAYTETSSVFVSLCSEYRKRSTAYRSHGNLIPLWFSQSRPHCLIPRSRGARNMPLAYFAKRSSLSSRSFFSTSTYKEGCFKTPVFKNESIRISGDKDLPLKMSIKNSVLPLKHNRV